VVDKLAIRASSISNSELLGGIALMSVFTAEEDKSLILLVVMFESASGDIDWNLVLHHLSPTTKTIEELQKRLIYLKESNRSVINALPANFLAGSSLERPRTNEEIYEAVQEIFYSLTRADVRQPSGLSHFNSGEIAPIGVTAIVQAINLQANDVFVDVGSGTGSVLAQIVLQSQVSRVIGVEIRQDLAQKSRESIELASAKYPALRKIQIFTDDVKNLKWPTMIRLSESTVIFANNILFEPEVNLALLELICHFSKRHDLRIILISQRFCGRCHTKCSNEFCNIWKEDRTVVVRTCWKDKPIQVYLYRKKDGTAQQARKFTLEGFLNDM
jgi:Histone methylation protein DOT1